MYFSRLSNKFIFAFNSFFRFLFVCAFLTTHFSPYVRGNGLLKPSVLWAMNPYFIRHFCE